MHVLQVVTDDDRRGAQVFAVDLEVALVELGHQVKTVALARGAVGGLPVEVLGRERLHPLTMRRLRALMKGPDVVIGHGSTTLPACAIAGLGLGSPFVYRQISDSLFWANTWRRRTRVRWALRRARRVVALWHGAADVLVTDFGMASERIDCIVNGVPVTRFGVADAAERREARSALGVDVGTPLVAYVGALVHEKGVDTAVDAIGQVSDAVLLVVGDGPQRRTLERRARHVGDRVRFAGSLPDVRQVLAAADVMVLPSRGGDSMPAVLIEAGLTGVPAISTPVAAIPEIVVDGTTGFIVPSDDAGALASAIRKIVADEDLRAGLARAARAHCVRHYSIEAVATEWDRTLHRSTRHDVVV